MPITFETAWLAAEEIRGPELASTWASLLIRVDDSVVTRVVDERAQTVRDHIYVPLYPLAESLATNWWFMPHEVGNPAKNHDAAFKRRHALVSARDGYAFPNLQVASSETRTCLAWTPETLRWARLDYQGENQVWIDRDEFRECCAELVDRVVRRLVSCGVEGTLLQEEWASIEAADQDESHFCRAAAGLGWDPYSLSDAQQAAVLRLDNVLDDAIFDEAITVLQPEIPLLPRLGRSADITRLASTAHPDAVGPPAAEPGLRSRVPGPCSGPAGQGASTSPRRGRCRGARSQIRGLAPIDFPPAREPSDRSDLVGSRRSDLQPALP